MFEGFRRSEIKASGARILTVHGGAGPPLLLMHGNPFSHLSWHKIAPVLAREFTVVATADPDYFIEKKLAKTEKGLSFFDPAALAEYKRYFRNPETIHAMCEDYRATHGVDLTMDEEDFVKGRKIMPSSAAVGSNRRRRSQS